MTLNPEQSVAVAHRGSPLLVLAGAGTGKTRAITHRVAALLDEGVAPWRILAVTFTNKAAHEMRERIDGLCQGRHKTREIWVGTFHSICARILRRWGQPLGLSPHFTIYDSADSASVMKRVLDELNVSDRLYTPKGVLTWIDRAKNRGLAPGQLDQLGVVEPVRSVVERAYTAYQRRLITADAVDFGDLLVHAVELLRRAGRPALGQLDDTDPVRALLNRFAHVVVDEFQDTNPVQAELVDRLAGSADLCVVGDDDQAIYGWRGADVDQILQFADRHPGTRVVRLEHNYRSSGNILRCADAVISRNRGRLGKTLWTDAGDGDPVRVLMLETEREEARFIAREIANAIDEGDSPEQFAIFYRTHAQSRVLEDALRSSGLGCRIVGGVAFYERAEVKDILAYLVVLQNPNSDAHLTRILNRPARGIGTTTVNRILEFAAGENISMWSALTRVSETGLGAAAAKRISAFVSLLEGLQVVLAESTLDTVVEEIIERTGYRDMLMADGDEEATGRLENLQELLGNVIEFLGDHPEAGLAEYLEQTSLAGGERTQGDAARAVTLMTVHSAKGLEFDAVYLTGLEERVFPHARVLDDPVQMEEERRLAYVALTRARHRLTLTMAAQRRLYGQQQVGTPSRFVCELPPEATETAGRRRRAVAAPRPTPLEREPSWNSDVHYDHDPGIELDPDELAGEVDGGVSLYVGMRFRHKTFGEGELLGWQGMGKHLKFHLRFGSTGSKTILARFCEPL